MAQDATDLEKGIVGRDDWQRRWDEGDTGFHKPVHNPRLDKFETKMLNGKHKRIFAPLSGKSPDLLWAPDKELVIEYCDSIISEAIGFYNKGHTVVGVDIIEQPCKSFFEENQLEFTVEGVSSGKVYKSGDGRLQLYAANLFDLSVGDGRLQLYAANLFDLSVDLLGKFDVIWDCSSLCAINVNDYQLYFDLMMSLMKADSQIYLNVREYDPSVWPGPPHSISEECVQDIYGSRCTIEMLEKTESTNKDSFTVPAKPADCDTDKPTVKLSNAGQAIQKSSYVFHYCFLIVLK